MSFIMTVSIYAENSRTYLKAEELYLRALKIKEEALGVLGACVRGCVRICAWRVCALVSARVCSW